MIKCRKIPIIDKVSNRTLMHNRRPLNELNHLRSLKRETMAQRSDSVNVLSFSTNSSKSSATVLPILKGVTD